MQKQGTTWDGHRRALELQHEQRPWLTLTEPHVVSGSNDTTEV